MPVESKSLLIFDQEIASYSVFTQHHIVAYCSVTQAHKCYDYVNKKQ